MIKKIAQKEFTELRRDGRFRLLVGIVSVTLLSSLFAGWYYYAEARAERERAQTAERDRWLNKGEMSGHSAAHFGQFAFKTDSPLFAVDQGVSGYMGTAVFLEAHSHNPFVYKAAADTTAPRRYGELTAAAVLQIFVPLLIVLLVFPFFVGEREQGTLRQLLSLNVYPRDLALGKLLGAVAPLLLILLPLAFVGVTALRLYAGEDFTPELWLRIGLMTLCYLMYFTIFAGASLIVSALARSSRQTLVVLLAFWFFNCLLMPPVAADTAQKIYPAMDGFELPATIANAGANMPSRDSRLPEIEKRLLAEYGVQRVEDLPVDPRRVASMEVEVDNNRMQEKVFNDLHDAYERQDRVYQGAGFFAPALAVQTLSMSLSGTHFANYRRFADAAETYRQNLVRTMDEADTYSENAKPGSTKSIVQNRETWEKVPPFEYAAPPLRWSLGKAAIGIGMLSLWFVGILLLTPLAISRLKAD